MKTIRLTHNNQTLDLSPKEAIGLHKALGNALANAGIDPIKHATVELPKDVETFSAKNSQNLTDC